MNSGLDFDNPKNRKDVAWLGDCDEGCLKLADALGFGDDLRKLIASETERLTKEGSMKEKL